MNYTLVYILTVLWALAYSQELSSFIGMLGGIVAWLVFPSYSHAKSLKVGNFLGAILSLAILTMLIIFTLSGEGPVYKWPFISSLIKISSIFAITGLYLAVTNNNNNLME